MKQFKWIGLSAAVGLALAGPTSSAARADLVLVDVYEYAGNNPALGTDASAATLTNILASPGSYTHYQFTYNGLNNIAWNNSNGQSGSNLGSDFVTAGNIVSFTGGLAQQTAFMNSTLSVALDSKTAFFDISGVISGTILAGTAQPFPNPPTGSFISHDDGATFIIGGVTQFSNAPETNDANDVVPGGTFAGAAFNLYYVEGNGAPAILDVHLAGGNFTTDVPESSTWAMMILGFFGVGFMAYRRKSKFSLRLA